MNSNTNHTLSGQVKASGDTNIQQSKPTPGADIRDSRNDELHLQSDEADLELPDVEDIPGQENIAASSLGYLAGTTISSGDEEGEGILDRDEATEEDEDGIVMGTDADVTNEDIEVLEGGFDYMPTTDEENLRQSAMDDTDEDGDILNEASFGKDVSGSDLDIPGSEEDDQDENIGEEDEENNSYSLGGDNHDDTLTDSL